MNQEKMLDVLVAIERSYWNEDGYLGYCHYQGAFYEKDDCGTTACLAGWTGVLEGAVPLFINGVGGTTHTVRTTDGREMDVEFYAAEVLGLTRDERRDLFYHCEDLKEIYYRVAGFMGVDDQVLRDKVQDKVKERV